jgi:hypothetical protein
LEFSDERIGWESKDDVLIELFGVKDIDFLEDGFNEREGSEEGIEMFGGEDRLEVVRIHNRVVATPLFRVDIPLSSQCIGFNTELTRTETDDEVEGREKLGPARLAPSEEFHGTEILQIFVVGDDVDWVWSTLEVMAPCPKGLMDRKKFLIMDIVVEFGR